MGDTSYTGNTSSFTSQYFWINIASSSNDNWYRVSKSKKEDKGFIKESEFKV